MAEAKSEDHIPVERIAAQIYVIRGQRVMLDSDLAELYGVSTSRLNEQVKRNARRFPDDFSFQLTAEEASMSQFAISKDGWGGRRKLPRVFEGELLATGAENGRRGRPAGFACASRGQGIQPPLARTDEPAARDRPRREVYQCSRACPVFTKHESNVVVLQTPGEPALEWTPVCEDLQAARIVRILRELDIAITPQDMALPGYRLHALKGELAGYWSVRVSANWRILFRMEDGDVFDVDLTDYH